MISPSDNIWSKLPEFDPSPDLWNRIDLDLDFESVSENINHLPEFAPKTNLWESISRKLFFHKYYGYIYIALILLIILLISFLNYNDKAKNVNNLTSNILNQKMLNYKNHHNTTNPEKLISQYHNINNLEKGEDRIRNSEPNYYNPLKGLIAWYPFNSNANDLSGNGNNGFVHNAVLTTDRFGNPNSAYYFNGYDSYIEVANSSSLNPTNALSLCAWYKPEAFSNDGSSGILDKGFTSFEPPYYQYRFATPGDYSTTTYDMFSFSVTNNDKSKGFNTPNYFYTIGKWYFLVGIYDGSTLKFYVNNKLIQSMPLTAKLNTYNSPLYIGRNSVDSTGLLKGTVDDIRIYNRAITASEAENLYNETAENGIKSEFTQDIINLVVNQDFINKKLTVETNSNAKQNLEIINLKGQPFYSAIINKKTVVDISGFPKGVYKLKVFTDREMHIEMFVKQ
ncbi:MAG: T9SS type A sorting domain-containing protein [Bacteroidetes bacterium]|nr:T9SS type A sorting domain-containing protein [Bacteroidota bacterium]